MTHCSAPFLVWPRRCSPVSPHLWRGLHDGHPSTAANSIIHSHCIMHVVCSANQRFWSCSTAENLLVLTCPLKSFWIGWFCFTLQEFLNMKANDNISTNTNRSHPCVHTCGQVWWREEKLGDRGSLTAGPYSLALFVLRSHALLKVLNYTQQKKQINEEAVCQI